MNSQYLLFFIETQFSFIEKSPRARLRIIKRWCYQILQGLEYLHLREPSIIHRDIKCDNIFINGITTEGEIKIGNIGLVTFSSRTDAISVIGLNFILQIYLMKFLTKNKFLLGTPHFMAPEYYTKSYCTAVDIWAFGMAILEMITWTKPYFECGNNVGQIVEKVSNFELPMQFDAILDPQVKNFIAQCFKPQNERPTASQLLQDPFFSTESEADNLPVTIGI